MQQQVNQMMMQITAGVFGMKHLAEQEAARPLTPMQKKKQEKQAEIENRQMQDNYASITNTDITDTKAAEAIGKEKGIDSKYVQEQLD